VPTLREVQEAVKAFMLRGGGPVAFVVTDGLAAEDRLGIYRNTYLSSLVAALRISYPAVRKLVGADFFEGAARAYIDAHPPRSACLNDYGDSFGDFLAVFEPARSLAYLADVSRLEWAVNVALHAEDVAALDIARLAGITEEIAFVPHPSVSLLVLAYRADAIWRAVLDGDDGALTAIDVEGPATVLVSRGPMGVIVERIADEDNTFAAALFAGAPLARALESAPGDMSGELARHLAAGRFIDFVIAEEGRRK
jgi:hypothetical protein